MADIMITDDSAFMRTVLRNILESAGHHVVAEANNGLAAVAEFRKYRPDIVTMDITMPEADGIAATRLIRAIDPGARVIIVSAMGQHYFVTDALRAGAASYLVKPFKRDEVLREIRSVLNMNRN